MRLLHRSCRIEEIGRDEAVKALEKGGVLLTWHCYLWIIGIHWAPSKYTALAGVSKKGEIISRTLERLGWKVVRGSSTDSAIASLRAMIALLQQGIRLVLTPDGPRGPAKRIKDGAILLQRKSGLPLIPVGVYSDRNYVFSRTWDGSLVPLPNSRIVIYYGSPIENLTDMDRDEAAALINGAMADAESEAESAVVRTRHPSR